MKSQTDALADALGRTEDGWSGALSRLPRVCSHDGAFFGDLFHSVLSVAAFASSPIKDGLQPLGEGCDWRLCTGIMRLTQASWNALFKFLGSFRQCVVFLERRRLVSPDIGAADVAPRGQPFQHW